MLPVGGIGISSFGFGGGVPEVGLFGKFFVYAEEFKTAGYYGIEQVAQCPVEVVCGDQILLVARGDFVLLVIGLAAVGMIWVFEWSGGKVGFVHVKWCRIVGPGSLEGVDVIGEEEAVGFEDAVGFGVKGGGCGDPDHDAVGVADEVKLVRIKGVEVGDVGVNEVNGEIELLCSLGGNLELALGEVNGGDLGA